MEDGDGAWKMDSDRHHRPYAGGAMTSQLQHCNQVTSSSERCFARAYSVRSPPVLLA